MAFSKSSQKIEHLQISEHISERRVERGFGRHFEWILGPFSDALERQNRKKGDPKMRSKRVLTKGAASRNGKPQDRGLWALKRE